MADNILIAPSILSADFAAMGDAVRNLEKWRADWVHCDVMDGRFVPNITFGMPMVEALRRNTSLTLDVHLMIVEPEKYVERFVKAGADIVTFHPDASGDVHGTLAVIKSAGAKCGLVLNPDIAIDSVEPYLDECDVVMLMGVFPGFGGQKFIRDVLPKLTELKALRGDRKFLIELDGGVTEDNAKEIVAAGADVLVAGSSVFKSQHPQRTIEILRTSTR